MDDERPVRRGYPGWAWVIGALFLFPLAPMLVGTAVPRTRRYLSAPGIIVASILMMVVVGVFGAVFGSGDNSSRSTPTPARSTHVSATPVPASPTRTPTAPPVPRGIGVSRYAIQSAYEVPGIDFVFDPPGALRDGRPRVMGISPDGLTLIELIGPADNLSSALIAVELRGYDNVDSATQTIYLLAFIVNAVPTWDEGPDWLADNLEQAVIRGSTTTAHSGVRITVQWSEELRWLSLNIEPDR